MSDRNPQGPSNSMRYACSGTEARDLVNRSQVLLRRSKVLVRGTERVVLGGWVLVARRQNLSEMGRKLVDWTDFQPAATWPLLPCRKNLLLGTWRLVPTHQFRASANQTFASANQTFASPDQKFGSARQI